MLDRSSGKVAVDVAASVMGGEKATEKPEGAKAEGGGEVVGEGRDERQRRRQRRQVLVDGGVDLAKTAGARDVSLSRLTLSSPG